MKLLLNCNVLTAVKTRMIFGHFYLQIERTGQQADLSEVNIIWKSNNTLFGIHILVHK